MNNRTLYTLNHNKTLDQIREFIRTNGTTPSTKDDADTLFHLTCQVVYTAIMEKKGPAHNILGLHAIMEAYLITRSFSTGEPAESLTVPFCELVDSLPIN